MKLQYIYIANIKSYLTVEQEIELFKNYLENLISIDKKIIFCPSFLSLYALPNDNESLFLGAQNCSPFAPGPYTGEVSAVSLVAANCNYCIVGHSERRQYFNETNEIISKKIELLLKNNIVPILCVGETQNQYEKKETKQILKDQLEIIKDYIQEIIIAYEPVWAIGTGIRPSVEYINEIYNFIDNLIDNKYRILYGGSVNPELAKKLKNETEIDGFLIGKASTDFQEFKKIVLS